jgi:hypothetical protein
MFRRVQQVGSFKSHIFSIFVVVWSLLLYLFDFDGVTSHYLDHTPQYHNTTTTPPQHHHHHNTTTTPHNTTPHRNTTSPPQHNTTTPNHTTPHHHHNRLIPEVLSVCTVQFKSVCDGVKIESARIVIESDEVSLDPTCGAFITMNPGYLGRSELPEGLKALFR